jgi:hypothetical protein
MRPHLAITTFSEAGYQTYGRSFLESFLEHWPIPIRAFHEGKRPNLQHSRLEWRCLDDDQDRARFIAAYSGPEFNHKTDFNMMAVKFSHKIWAITQPHDARWLLWLDADTLCTRPVESHNLDAICPPDKSLVYIGRQGELRPGQPMYPETGFVAYRTEHWEVATLLTEMRAIYTTGKLFTLGQHNWHDAYVFDFCRTRSAIPAERQLNLGASIKGRDVFGSTILDRWLTHFKGPRAKLAQYGSIA